MRLCAVPVLRAAAMVLLGMGVLAWPVASAAPYVHAQLEPDQRLLSLARGSRLEVPYTWRITFENTTCPANVDAAVDLFPEGVPPWMGASFHPASGHARPPGAEGSTLLEVQIGAQRPPAAEASIQLTAFLNVANATACVPAPLRLEDGATLTVRVDDAGGIDGTTRPRADIPGFGAAVAWACLGGWAAWRRRCVPSEPATVKL